MFFVCCNCSHPMVKNYFILMHKNLFFIFLIKKQFFNQFSKNIEIILVQNYLKQCIASSELGGSWLFDPLPIHYLFEIYFMYQANKNVIRHMLYTCSYIVNEKCQYLLLVMLEVDLKKCFVTSTYTCLLGEFFK